MKPSWSGDEGPVEAGAKYSDNGGTGAADCAAAIPPGQAKLNASAAASQPERDRAPMRECGFPSDKLDPLRLDANGLSALFWAAASFQVKSNRAIW